jgi:hypothetical protein
MRKVLEGTERSFQNHYIGKRLLVRWESATALGSKGWGLQGLTDNYSRVSTVAPEPLWNQIRLVEITGSNGTGLIGNVVET